VRRKDCHFFFPANYATENLDKAWTTPPDALLHNRACQKGGRNHMETKELEQLIRSSMPTSPTNTMGFKMADTNDG
jgi:hypothetical protein